MPPAVFLLTALFLALLLRWRRFFPVDHPNDRSLHTVPTPRLGGVAMIVALAVAGAASDPLPPAYFFLIGLGFFSFMDDRYGLPAFLRLSVHLAASAGFLALSGLGANPRLFLVATLAIAWSTNLFNFMDGSDGLAGGMGLFGFSFFGAAAILGGDAWIAQWSFGLAAAAGAFLLFNFPPAKVFMGDAGSIPMGFAAGALGAAGVVRGTWSFWFPFVVFAPFFVDATVTLVRRTLRGEPVWRAHRTHYYQRLIQMGWSHRRTAGVEYAAMAACGLGALGLLSEPPAAVAASLAASGIVGVSVLRRIDRSWARRHPRGESA